MNPDVSYDIFEAGYAIPLNFKNPAEANYEITNPIQLQYNIGVLDINLPKLAPSEYVRTSIAEIRRVNMMGGEFPEADKSHLIYWYTDGILNKLKTSINEINEDVLEEVCYFQVHERDAFEHNRIKHDSTPNKWRECIVLALSTLSVRVGSSKSSFKELFKYALYCYSFNASVRKEGCQLPSDAMKNFLRKYSANNFDFNNAHDIEMLRILMKTSNQELHEITMLKAALMTKISQLDMTKDYTLSTCSSILYCICKFNYSSIKSTLLTTRANSAIMKISIKLRNSNPSVSDMINCLDALLEYNDLNYVITERNIDINTLIIRICSNPSLICRDERCTVVRCIANYMCIGYLTETKRVGIMSMYNTVRETVVSLYPTINTRDHLSLTALRRANALVSKVLGVELDATGLFNDEVLAIMLNLHAYDVKDPIISDPQCALYTQLVKNTSRYDVELECSVLPDCSGDIVLTSRVHANSKKIVIEYDGVHHRMINLTSERETLRTTIRNVFYTEYNDYRLVKVTSAEGDGRCNNNNPGRFARLAGQIIATVSSNVNKKNFEF